MSAEGRRSSRRSPEPGDDAASFVVVQTRAREDGDIYGQDDEAGHDQDADVREAAMGGDEVRHRAYRQVHADGTGYQDR